MPKLPRFALIAVPLVCLAAVLVGSLPPIQTRLQIWTAEIGYALNPPDEIVFIPQEQRNQIEILVSGTLEALQPTETPSPTPDHTATPTQPGPTPTPTHTPTLTQTPTPVPESALISGMGYQTQRGLWNYCGPANLAMNLTFWGWETTREQVGTILRGGDPKARVGDKNVMPYEMANYVSFQTGLGVVTRMGGNLDLIKSLVAAGYPVIVEREDTLQDIGWVGHYLTIYGYDDAAGEFISNDTYHGEGKRYTYEFILDSWRPFNYTFLVVYPRERETDLMRILGPFADNEWSIRHALEIAQQEAAVMSGLAAYYAWFNVGTSYVNLFDYGPASVAYDTAFSLYGQILDDIPSNLRPWRMMWYQTGPYFAYYYTGRYQDVFNLADTTLNAMNTPILEESFYWRGLAREALGDYGGALADLQTSVNLNPNFGPGWSEIERMTGG